MDVILIKDMPGLGFKNEIVKIKNGYGRNYLIPKGYAILANSSNSKILNEILKQTKNKQEEILNKSKELSKNIGELIIDIPIKVGSENKIFGTITTAQISDLLNKKGFDINKKNISILSKINNIGIYDVNLSIHKEITHPIKVNVIPSKEKSKKEKATKKTSEKEIPKKEKATKKTSEKEIPKKEKATKKTSEKEIPKKEKATKKTSKTKTTNKKK